MARQLHSDIHLHKHIRTHTNSGHSKINMQVY